MSSDEMKRGEDVKEIHEDDWTVLWDGTDDGWIRCLDAPDLDEWR